MDPVVWLVVFCLGFLLVSLSKLVDPENRTREQFGTTIVVLGATGFSMLLLEYRGVVNLEAGSIIVGVFAVVATIAGLALFLHGDQSNAGDGDGPNQAGSDGSNAVDGDGPNQAGGDGSNAVDGDGPNQAGGDGSDVRERYQS